MFTNRISKLFVVLLVLTIALMTIGFASRSASLTAADRSYDLIEQLRSHRPAAFIGFSYDQIEALRVQRGTVSLTANSGYDAIEQLRLGRAFHADHSYEKIEVLRLDR
jgi:hypothetical protein